MLIEIGKEYIFKKSGNKIKILRNMFENVYEAKKYNGDNMVVSTEFLEEVPTTEELIESGVKKRRGRPKLIKEGSNIEEV